MSLEVKGTVLRIEEVNQISDSFKKREVVLTTGDDKYKQIVAFQLSQDKVDLINGYNAGDELTLHFNLRGREWTSPKDQSVKVFNTLDVWKIDGEAKVQPQGIAPDENFFTDEQDLPF